MFTKVREIGMPRVFARVAMLQPIHAQFAANAVAGFLGRRADSSTLRARFADEFG
jgi:hypothetical protein